MLRAPTQIDPNESVTHRRVRDGSTRPSTDRDDGPDDHPTPHRHRRRTHEPDETSTPSATPTSRH
ncbi:MAG: hypothetical protein U5Q44_10530 [Dehalococcoidia bacterium]|nr:hypothetical protein [Dehalococcoidia bacterium]